MTDRALIGPSIRHSQVAGYAQFMARETRGAVVLAANGGLSLVSGLLDSLGVVDKAAHTSRFGVTLGVTVCLPFEPGTEDPAWPIANQIRMIGHEFTHVLQFQGLTLGTENLLGKPEPPGVVFAADYVSNEESRAYYEVEGYGTGDEIAWEMFGVLPDPAFTERTLVTNYAVTLASAKYARDVLELRRRTTLAHRHASPITALTFRYFDVHPSRPSFVPTA